MNNLDSFLKKILQKVHQSETIDKEVVEIIRKHTNTPITKDIFSIKDKILITNTHPAIKQDLLLKKEKILEDFKNKSIEIIDLR